MPLYKYTMVFEYLSGVPGGASTNRKGGWTESVYWNNVSTGALNSFKLLCQARAGLLPQYSQIVGIRRQQVDPIGSASTVAVNYPGDSAANNPAADIPQMALLLSIPANGVRNIRRYRICALRDADVVRGEFVPGVALPSYRYFFLKLNGWLLRGKDATAPKKLIATIAADGTYVLNEDLVLTVGQTVFVGNTLDALRQTESTKAVVEVYTDSKHGKLRNWTLGACTLGYMQAVTYTGYVMNTSDLQGFRIVTRKIGRPSTGYRGRRSKRKA